MPIEGLHNEKEVLGLVASGDREAFRVLYTHYFPLVQQYVSLFAPAASSLNELTQDVFVRIWEKRDKLAQVDAFQSYLFLMTRNQIFNYVKALKIQQRHESIDPESSSPASEQTDHRLLFSQYYQIAMEAIEQLPAGRKKILKMSIEEGLSLDEIAARLNISKSGVKNQLYAATAFVRQYLRDHAEISVLLFVFLSLFEG